jgi:signal transduction histidine kinase
VAQRYAAAVIVTVIVLAGRWAMNPVWGERSNRHLVFLPTVMLVTWFGGFGPGVLSAILCTTALWFFWMAPVHSLPPASADVALFFAVAIAIAALVESLRRARARADAGVRAREQVLAVVAHDLRNPLAAIRLTAGRLIETAPNDEQLRQRLHAIDRSAQRMDNLIRNLLDAARIDHGQVQLTMRNESVASIVHEAVDMFGFLARAKGLQIETTMPNSPITVACDRERVLQVLGNLIGNALRFTPERGCIRLLIEPQPGGVRFEVEDSGPGIKQADLVHIFEPYWHSDSKGTGLGLYIAQSLIRAHGSSIEVDGRPGQGARFSFVLPAGVLPGPASSPGEAQPAPA